MKISNTTLLVALLFAGAANCDRLDPDALLAEAARQTTATEAWSTLELLEEDIRGSALAR